MIRMGLSFNLDNEEQKRAYDFLEKLNRTKTQFVSDLVIKYLEEHNLNNVSELSSKEVKKLVERIQEEQKEHNVVVDKNISALLEALTSKVSRRIGETQEGIATVSAEPVSIPSLAPLPAGPVIETFVQERVELDEEEEIAEEKNYNEVGEDDSEELDVSADFLSALMDGLDSF